MAKLCLTPKCISGVECMAVHIAKVCSQAYRMIREFRKARSANSRLSDFVRSYLLKFKATSDAPLQWVPDTAKASPHRP